ncbi:unnamed protein product (macronuclear) [Paramecium tetraurelia]|uniref:Transmembrane protein n=1 Tax=Paramecium tetraurelia TaxID=5888 RepID=A0DIF5_PARTE|nr:uncharacterized protein GSPATT00017194001 [Paramecium tetraurelia]CAK82822.1 unnamed protein product [Paramecium tetraurelia]|eukprot:XP_001450219.1 hypothetical protein (macronuclear) [Paramecium tetraurelia strain d4-2]
MQSQTKLKNLQKLFTKTAYSDRFLAEVNIFCFIVDSQINFNSSLNFLALFIAKQVSGSFQKYTALNYQSQFFEKNLKTHVNVNKNHMIFNKTQKKVFNYLQKSVVCVKEKINQGLYDHSLVKSYLKRKREDVFRRIQLKQKRQQISDYQNQSCLQYNTVLILQLKWKKLSKQLRYNKPKTHKQVSTPDRRETQNKKSQRWLPENRFKNLNTLQSSKRKLKDVKLNQIRSKQDFLVVENFTP